MLNNGSAENGALRYFMTSNENVQAQQPDDPSVYDSADDLLILIDFQNVYLPGQPWACPTMEQAIENTLSILRSPDHPDYVLTQYLPPADPVGRWKRYNEEYAEINADAFLSDFPESVRRIITEDNLIVKDTYSSLKSANIKNALEGKKRVVLTGVVAECCVLATMMDAIDLGYEVVYLYDCISGFTAENEKMIRTLAESFSPIHTRVMSSEAYKRLISAGQ